MDRWCLERMHKRGTRALLPLPGIHFIPIMGCPLCSPLPPCLQDTLPLSILPSTSMHAQAFMSKHVTHKHYCSSKQKDNTCREHTEHLQLIHAKYRLVGAWESLTGPITASVLHPPLFIMFEGT